jgi:hypothetical protein
VVPRMETLQKYLKCRSKYYSLVNRRSTSHVYNSKIPRAGREKAISLYEEILDSILAEIKRYNIRKKEQFFMANTRAVLSLYNVFGMNEKYNSSFKIPRKYNSSFKIPRKYNSSFKIPRLKFLV